MHQRALYGWCYAAAAAVALAAAFILPSDEAIGTTIEISSEKQAAMLLQTFDSMIGLITTLNTAMLAAAAAVAVKGSQWSRIWTPFDAAVVVCVFICGAISYHGVYVAYVSLLEMIENKALTALGATLQLGFAMQYYGTLAGVLLLGLVFARLVAGRKTEAPTEKGRKRAAAKVD